MDNKLNKCLISEELLLIEKRLKIIINDNLFQDFVEIKANNEEISEKPKDIKFIGDREEFGSHSEVLKLLNRDLISKEQTFEDFKIFTIKGTNPQAFRKL
jgi:hypothetical protein